MATFDYITYQKMFRIGRYIRGLTSRGAPVRFGNRLNRRKISIAWALETRSDYLKTPEAKAQWREQARKRMFELSHPL